MIAPALFGQWNEQGARGGRDRHLRRLPVEGILVCTGTNGAFGADDSNPSGAAGQSRADPRFDHPENRDRRNLGQGREGVSRSGVAGNHQQPDIVVEEMGCGFEGVSSDGRFGFRTIGEAGRVTQVEIVLTRKSLPKGRQHGQSADARVEDAYRSAHYLPMRSLLRTSGRERSRCPVSVAFSVPSKRIWTATTSVFSKIELTRP